MKLIIDIDNDYFEIIKYRVEHGDDYKPYTLIANGIPYDEAEKARKQGEWVKIGNIGLAYTCNKCGEVNVIPTNFCPNCGAPMKKGGAV